MGFNPPKLAGYKFLVLLFFQNIFSAVTGGVVSQNIVNEVIVFLLFSSIETEFVHWNVLFSLPSLGLISSTITHALMV